MTPGNISISERFFVNDYSRFGNFGFKCREGIRKRKGKVYD